MRMKANKPKGKIRKIAIVVTVMLLLLFCSLLARDIHKSNKEKQLYDNLAEQIRNLKSKHDDTVQSHEILPWLKNLYNTNDDLIGWLEVAGTKINYPVVQTPNEPQEYLRKDIEGKESFGGTLFVDWRCDVDMPSDNLIIYGHNMKNDSMFGTLDNFAKKDFWLENNIIKFSTLYEEREYIIFSVFCANVEKQDDNLAYYNFINARDIEEFESYISNIKGISLYDTEILVDSSDELITLSTCSYHEKEGRFVVMGKRIK